MSALSPWCATGPPFPIGEKRDSAGNEGAGGWPVRFPPRLMDGAWVALFTVLISFVATLYPFWSAARILPAEALRYE